MRHTMDAIAHFFDHEFAGYRDDLPTLEAYARRTGGPLIEFGCGTGRALIPLAQAGFAVTGVDCSPAMLAIARQKAEAAGVSDRITLLEADFARTGANGPFKLAFTVMNTFLHLTTQADQRAALAHWRTLLAPRGLLIIDVLHPDVATLAGLDGRLEWWGDWDDPRTGQRVTKLIARTVDLAEQTLQIRHLYDAIDAEGQVRRTMARYDLRYLWRFEAELLLDQAGFDLEGLYGDWDLGPFEGGSERMILVARPRR